MRLVRFNMFGRGRRIQTAIFVTCSCAFVLFGYDQGVFSGIVNNPDWLQVFGNPSSGLEGIIVSIYNLGAFAGCILTFIIGEKIGRRWCIFSAMCIIIIGAVLQASSYSVAQIMVARFITGVGTGLDTSTVPMYQAENCDANIRGRIISAEPLFVGVGIVVSYFFDYGMGFVGGPVSWRVPIACQAFFAFLSIFFVLGVPESARWLFYHNRHDEAMQVLCEIYDAPEDDPRIQRQKTDVLETMALEEKHGKFRWRDVFKRDEVQTGRRVLLAYGMQFMNQMGGINFLVYFVPSALKDNVGVDPNLAQVIGGTVNVCFIIGSIVPALFLDKLGRRKPMMIGSTGLGISMMMIAILLSINTHATNSASVAFFYVYMLTFGASVNCIPWVYVPEILPLHARAKGSAVGISANWLWNFVVVMISPTMISNLGWQGYLVWMCTNFAFVPLVYFFYPETANLTLEEVDYLFTAKGDTGVRALTHPTKPVLESLKAERRHGRNGDEEKVAGSDEPVFADHFEEKGAASDDATYDEHVETKSSS